MSQGLMSGVIVAVLLPLWWRLRRDYVSGVAYGMVVLIAFTHLLRIPSPGALPDFTIHRLVILSFLVFWIQRREPGRALSDLPISGKILMWASVAFISLLGAVDHAVGLKRYLDYVLEFFLLYFILATSLRTRQDGIRILGAACAGLTIVALLAAIEKYAGFNVVERYIAYDPEQTGTSADVIATYRHRILLGTGMAMGFPVALYFSITAASVRGRRLAWFAMLSMLAACYFAMSRGPWLGAVLASLVMYFLGSPLLRKRVIIIFAIGGCLLLLRPGVYTTLFTRAEATIDVDSHKGGTFRYRLELWRIAMSEVADSPWRTLFGHGPGSGATQSLDWTLSYRDQDFIITSWDNDFAYALYQYGYLGLIATLLLYGMIVWGLFRLARARDSDQNLYACLAASAFVFFFMMSNVMIFTRQVHYLLWTITAVGLVVVAARKPSTDASPEARPEVECTAAPSTA